MPQNKELAPDQDQLGHQLSILRQLFIQHIGNAHHGILASETCRRCRELNQNIEELEKKLAD